MARVSRHARALGRDVASDDLFLLALTEADEAGPARQALASAGLTSERVLDQIRATGDGADKPVQPALRFAPAYYKLLGLAQGFAAGLGDGKITSEHVLLAILWNGDRSLQVLWRLGVRRETILEHLRAAGVAVPAAALPGVVEVEWGARVWFERDQVARVLDHVRLQVAPGVRWAFNYEADRAWACAEASVDLAALVSAALASA
jgi:hypothetical protein